ncbi:MAG TPA: CHAT domain-containing protein [Thermoanaerobaculia bacterium]|nr:CHAT domain-containing protein [Thermoanaerobaculia bacterium]
MPFDGFRFFLDSLGLAYQLQDDSRASILERTLRWALAIRNPSQRSRALLLLHLDLEGPLKTQALRESRKAALAVTDESERRELLRLIKKPVRADLASWLEAEREARRSRSEKDPRDNPIEQTSTPTDPNLDPATVESTTAKPPYYGTDYEQFWQSSEAAHNWRPPYKEDGREQVSWKSPPARVVSTGFSAVEAPVNPLASDQPLLGHQWYFFWLEVGEPVPGAIDDKPSPLPTDLLPSGADLQVVLFTNEEDFELESRTGVLQLKPKGVEVLKPASVPSGISAGDPLLRQRLFFSVRTPEAPGRYQLRCNIYYRQVLVQGRRVNVTVSDAGASIQDALLTTLDYTLSRSLAAPHLQQIQEHRLSLMMNADGEDSHGFYFHGEEDFNSSARFDGLQVQSLIDRTRKALRAVSWGEEGEWKSDVHQYRYSARPTFDDLLPDLVRLARAGYLNYDAIINQLSGGPEGADRLAELMRRPGHLQLALRESARLMVPVALLYDHPLDTQLAADKVRLCPQFQRSSSADSPLEEGVCFLGDCPHREDVDVVCPSGFWGFRHSLGIPLTIGADRDSPPDAPGELSFEGFPDVTLSVCTDEQMRERLAHVEHLKALIPPERLHYVDTRESTLKIMKETKAHIVYFYCHGGRADGVPFLQVGPLSDPGIARDTLRWSKIRWSDPRPLVFINGCHTTDLEPENAIELLSGFVETAGASAVIGTEITIFEPLAVTFGEHFLRRFLTHGESLGEAVRSARLLLLKGLNPLGLVYLPFGLASLRLKEAESAPKPLAQTA